jgi:hypothetical protein
MSIPLGFIFGSLRNFDCGETNPKFGAQELDTFHSALSVSIRHSANANKTGNSTSRSVGGYSPIMALPGGAVSAGTDSIWCASRRQLLPHYRALNALSIQRRVKGVFGK